MAGDREKKPVPSGSGRMQADKPRTSAKVIAGGRPEMVSAARKAAFRVLVEVSAGKAHSDELLHASGASAALEGLSEADRNLAMALVMGVLRWQIALDGRLRMLFARPDSVVVPEVMVALRMGAFQLLHMDRIPAHAALSESVAIVRAAGQEYATGMVNAVLRKIAAGPKLLPTKIYETVPAMAERLGHPAWLVERWVDVYGRAAALAICESDQEEPRNAGVLSVGDGLPMMDEGSRLVAELAAAGVEDTVEGNVRVWDCCAAPGGKTAVLAARLAHAEILATDVSGRRLRSMEERLGAAAVSAGLGGRVRCLIANATDLPAAEGMFDLVLCDVPCSGTGTLARNPEVRLRLTAAELPRQALRQQQILRAAMARVAPGGRLLYSTCSLEPEECERVVEGALAVSGPDWRRISVAEDLEQLRGRGILLGDSQTMVRDGALRTLPGVHPFDGFYAVTLTRT